MIDPSCCELVCYLRRPTSGGEVAARRVLLLLRFETISSAPFGGRCWSDGVSCL
jgi:hypothetical protein